MLYFSLPSEAGRRAAYLCAVSAISAVMVLSGCSRQEAQQEPVRAVKVLTVGGSTLNVQFEYAAEVRARVESRLGFRVGGKLVQRQAEVGQRVSAGAWAHEIASRGGAQDRQATCVAVCTPIYDILACVEGWQGAPLVRRGIVVDQYLVVLSPLPHHPPRL